MTVTTHTCVVVYCHAPDCGPWQDIGDGAIPHFASTQEAVTALSGEPYGFTFGPDGAFCETCNDKRQRAVPGCEPVTAVPWSVTETCITIDCDTPGCGTSAGEEDGGTHFPSADLLRECGYLDDWRTTPEGTATCPNCLAAEQCRAAGHRWTGWGPARLEPGELSRWCRRCGTRETATTEPSRER